jgi:pimeloyl-ACP methyl ester carboxylesterase
MTIDLHMGILYRLLQTAGEDGPYIVVGHSIGRVMARTFAAQYPDETVGIVLVDSSVESQFSILPSEIVESNQAAGAIFSACRIIAPFGVIRLSGLGNSRAESFDLLSDDAQAAIANAFHQTRGCAALQRDGAVSDELLMTGVPFESLGDVPLVVITRGLAEQDVNTEANYSANQIALFDEVQVIWLDLQADLTDLSTDSRQVIAEQSGHYVHTTEPELVIDVLEDLLADDS